MNRYFTIAIRIIFLLFTLQSYAQTGIEKKLIATLGPGEKLANNENSFLLDRDPESFSFVTVTGSGSSKQYYCYGKDGNKSGPVKQPDPSYWAESKGTNIEDCMALSSPAVDDPEKYIDYNTGAVNFSGTKYGPYGQVMMLYLSMDEKSFYAVALTMEMKIIFFDSKGRKTELINIPEEVLVSPDGNRAYAEVKGTINMFEPGAAQKMMDNPEELDNPKINLFGIDGSKYGPYASDDFSDAWFIPSGQLVIYNNNEISLDGKFLFKSEDHIGKCDIWVSSDGKDYAWANYTDLIFSDGIKKVAPVVIELVRSAGKSYLKWIALENEKELVFYKKPF
jgi:hypothetical protein